MYVDLVISGFTFIFISLVEEFLEQNRTTHWLRNGSSNYTYCI